MPETDDTVAETARQPTPLGASVLGGMGAPEPAEALTTRAGPGRWTTVLWLVAGYILARSLPMCEGGLLQTKRIRVLKFPF